MSIADEFRAYVQDNADPNYPAEAEMLKQVLEIVEKSEAQQEATLAGM
jgi:hypothetical protein